MITMKYAFDTLKYSSKVENMIVSLERASVTEILPIFIATDEYTEDSKKSTVNCIVTNGYKSGYE